MANGMLFISDCSDQSDVNGKPLSNRHSKVNLLTLPSIPYSVNTIDIQNAYKISRRISTGFQRILGERIPMEVAQGGVGALPCKCTWGPPGKCRPRFKIYFFDFDFHPV